MFSSMSRYVIGVALLGLASGCVVAPPPRPVHRVVQPVSPPPPPPEEITEVVAYPSHGQTEQQLDRDRYECHNWAVKQTGFDPSIPGVPPHQRVRVVMQGPPPGAEVAGGAITGAVIGAAVSRPRDAGAGALIGAVAGAAIGAVAESSRAEATQAVEAREQERVANRSAGQEQRAGAYRRAISACLEGRGYSVR
jgi:Glycine zipper 2TM domain